ncbi:hypothetical protein ACFQZF_10235 [Flavobacterium myungsuense]|uniref:Uncharacterized protein n=1 Tax=Flavobacterium myungsuense TaxID=651823 RepID=A0ABW3J226_9FLAO
MENQKKIVIYLDHFTANLIEYTTTAKLVKTIKSDFNQFEKKKILQKGESHLHDKEQHLQLQFYKEISDNSVGFSIVVLLGPTTAKAELKTILSHDNRFSDADISLKITDKLNQKEQIAFVNNFFYIDTK